MTTTQSSKRALVVGLGIAGMSAAVALSKAGWTPVIVERVPARRRGGYFMGLFGSGRVAADRLGILDHMHDRRPADSVNYEIDREGNRRAGLGFSDIPDAPWMVLRGDVEQAAYDALPEGVEIRYSTSPTAIEQDDDGAAVTLHDTAADTTTLERFGLVVGADGLRSTVRRLAFGPHEDYLHRLGYMIAAFEMPTDFPGLEGRDGAILAEPGRSFWVFPFADHHPTVLFSYRTDDVDAEFTKSPVERLREVYGPEPLGDMIGAALDVMETADEYLFDSVKQVRMDSWHTGRVVLVGDAAWCVTLYAGMGATSGIAGAELLGQMLRDHPDDVPTALDSWEVKLRPYLAEFQKAGLSMRSIFTPADAREARTRKLTLGLRRRLMQNPVLGKVMGSTKIFRLRNEDMAAA